MTDKASHTSVMLPGCRWLMTAKASRTSVMLPGCRWLMAAKASHVAWMPVTDDHPPSMHAASICFKYLIINNSEQLILCVLYSVD